MTHVQRPALVNAALDIAARGWPVFPLRPGDKLPALHGADACPRSGPCADGHLKWEQRATADPARVRRCWQAGPFNIGVATGPGKLVVVDLDVPKGADDRPKGQWADAGVTDGPDAFAALCELHAQPYPADTFTVRTTRGGYHLYFTAPPGAPLRNTAGKLAWKVDTRAHGGYVVGPGSVVGRRSYRVVHDAPAAPLPRWLANLLTPAPLPTQKPVSVPLTATDRRTTYLRQAVEGEVRRVLTAGPGQRNTALYRAAVALGQLVAGGELTEADVTAHLTEAATQVGQKPREIPRTIASGLRAGSHRPRTVAA